MTVFSIVIPMKNEAGNVRRLVEEIDEACRSLPAFDLVIVDDGSDDETGEIARGLTAGGRPVRVLRHDESAGQSAAVHSGVQIAEGEFIVTLDGDGQNPPSEIPKLIAPLLDPNRDSRLGLIAGQRVGRQDTWSKKYASRFANGLRNRVLKDGTRDTGCGLKAFRRDAFLALPFFNHMHRYLPALFARDGWSVGHVDVSHRSRGEGRSNYSNLQRALVGIPDLIAVAWLIRRRKTRNSMADILTTQSREGTET
ncbi:glycosyltransferase family 2 protein [Notoacmeibacter ruber]|uniref:Glycosyltransferase family 2 protein n=1 Tax=Notoacmeibacter ruber TaxID=2670375 RepID=A0A3L7JBN6_9HYPH|nr:glycosyltransferase family 2 protein [Notoacmeibacter ruber]RLQ87890.1 glycosyltransferase family 2 protein [Notoacmeibacter ruber]